MSVRPVVWWGALGAAALLGHAGPGASWIAPLRLGALPRLAGLGRSDHLALTFDDGPDPAGTPVVLDALDRLGWRATFFMLGSQVAREPGLAAEVAAAGHEIGVHGYRHSYLLLRSPRDAYHDLAAAVAEVASATGTHPAWYRPPYGVLSTAGVVAARRLGVRTVLWSAWGKDWRADATPQSILAELRRGRLAGGTALLHDSDVDSAPISWRATAQALPLLAADVRRLGLTVGPLGEHGLPGARPVVGVP